MEPLRVLVADDHRLFRQGLISLMSTRRETFEVVGEASTGKDAVYQAQRLTPDLVLMDIMMPDGDGLQATETICRANPGVSVVILTASDSDEHLFQAAQVGAAGYLLKTMDAQELLDLILGAAQGQVVMTREMSARLLKQLANSARTEEIEPEPLTEREIEVLKLIVQGASNPEIASHLQITLNTAKTHVSHILQKLNLGNRTQVTAYAFKHDLVEPEH